MSFISALYSERETVWALTYLALKAFFISNEVASHSSELKSPSLFALSSWADPPLQQHVY